MNGSDMETFVPLKPVLLRIKFTIFLVLYIPAFLLSLLIFLFFIKNRTIRQAPHNRAMLLLLLFNFCQLSCTFPPAMNFYSHGYVRPATPSFCTWWTFIQFSSYVTAEYLMATISIQRHMLVFDGQALNIRWKRILLHHLPLLFCLIYPTTFYLFAIILYPCDGTQWDYTNNLCGLAECYLLSNPLLATVDWTVNNGLPMVVNALANVLLIVRVVRQKRRQRRPIRWKQQRRMTIQLLCISSLYLVAWSPSLIVALVQALDSPTFLADIQLDYFLDLVYTTCLFLPFISLGLLPELVGWLRRLLHCEPALNAVGTVVPQTIYGQSMLR